MFVYPGWRPAWGLVPSSDQASDNSLTASHESSGPERPAGLLPPLLSTQCCDINVCQEARHKDAALGSRL